MEKEQWQEVHVENLAQKLTELEYNTLTQDIDTETESMIEYSGQVYVERDYDGKYVALWEILLSQWVEIINEYKKER